MAEVTAQVVLRVRVRPGQDPTALERAIADEGRRAARELYQAVVTAEDDRAVGASGGARQRREARWVATLFGRVRILRYRVKVASESFHPLDRTLGLRRNEASPALQLLVVDLSNRLSHRDVARLVTEVTGETFAYQQVGRLVREHSND
jgi:hypothetical protein